MKTQLFIFTIAIFMLTTLTLMPVTVFDSPPSPDSPLPTPNLPQPTPTDILTGFTPTPTPLPTAVVPMTERKNKEALVMAVTPTLIAIPLLPETGGLK